MIRHLFILLFLVAAFVGCGNEEEERLKALVNKELPTMVAKSNPSGANLLRYRDEELKRNQLLADTLQNYFNQVLERKIESFEDQELGFVNGYRNMFYWLVSSHEQWADRLVLKSNHYFNPLDMNQEVELIKRAYLSDVKRLRTAFIEQGTVQVGYVQLDHQAVSLSTLTQHTTNSIGLELLSELFEWLIPLAIINLVLIPLGFVGEGKGCIVNIIVLIASIVISVFVTNANDTALTESIRTQFKQEYQFDRTKFLNELNQNTNDFYGKN